MICKKGWSLPKWRLPSLSWKYCTKVKVTYIDEYSSFLWNSCSNSRCNAVPGIRNGWYKNVFFNKRLYRNTFPIELLNKGLKINQLPLSTARWQHWSHICFATLSLRKISKMLTVQQTSITCEKISLDVASLDLKKCFDVSFIKFKINEILMDKLASNVKQHPSYILGQTSPGSSKC